IGYRHRLEDAFKKEPSQKWFQTSSNTPRSPSTLRSKTASKPPAIKTAPKSSNPLFGTTKIGGIEKFGTVFRRPKRRSCHQASLCDWLDTCLREKNSKSEQDNRLASQID
mgnify:CR=1